nr:hypothetical protein [Tanacetum cinerariifolium]
MAVKDAAKDEDDDNEVSAEPTPPLPTPATPPPSPTQEHIPSSPQAQTAQPSSPPPQQPLQTIRLLKPYRLQSSSKGSGGGCIQTEGREITELDADEDVTLVDAEEDVNADVQGRLAESEEKVVNTAATSITAAQVPKASAPRRRRGVVIQDPKETATALVIMHTKDDVMEQVKRKEKQDNTVMRYQALKRKPITEAQTRKNKMIYLKNMAGFKMDFFKGMTYNDIRPIFEKYYNSIRGFLEKGENEIEEEGSKRKGDSLNQDAAKKQRIDEEAEELKTHL